jgi:acetyl-CoA acetyltransferase
MAEAYIIDAVRTPVGKRNGALAGLHPIDLGVHAFRGIFGRKLAQGRSRRGLPRPCGDPGYGWH